MKTIFLSLFITLSVLRAYQIESKISSYKLRVNTPFELTISLIYSNNECKFDFPHEISFKDFHLIGSKVANGSRLVALITTNKKNTPLQTNKITTNFQNFNEITYTYELSPRTNGVVTIDPIAIAILNPLTSQQIDLTSTPPFEVSILPEKLKFNKTALIAFLILICVAYPIYFLFKKANKLKRKIQQQRFDQIYNTQKEILLSNQTLRFGPDRKEYLLFLINEFKKLYSVINNSSEKHRLQPLFNTLIENENMIKFSNSTDDNFYNQYITKIESMMLKES